jgi:predicted AAA+ superfamily ATPase
MVTGSARLDVYRRGGDSLMGRYYYYRLHPFSVAEFLEKQNSLSPLKEISLNDADRDTAEAFDLLWRFGGFPEPLLKQSERTLRRWKKQRIERLLREDIRDLENIRDLSSAQILIDMLPYRVGSLLSLNSLREDLSVDHKTMAHWMDILETFYYTFRIYPFTQEKIKSLRKQPKLYLLDWSEIRNNDGAKLENLVASHLLKLCHYLSDTQGYHTSLYYLRDVDKREVDFLITEGNQPWFAVEVKSLTQSVSRHLSYFGSRLAIPFLYQVTGDKGIDFKKDNVRVISADRFLASLI